MQVTLNANHGSDVDVLVCGGGPAGVAAAVAAARQGAKTLLVERFGCLGGVATNSLVGVWLGSYSRDGRFPVIAGLFQEVVDRLVAEGAAVSQTQDVISGTRHVGYGPNHGRTVPFEFEPCKRILDQFVGEAAARVLFFTTAIHPIVESRRIAQVLLHGKSGLTAVRPKTVVDATGDADLAFRAGCPTVKGRDEDALMTPASAIFVLEDVDSAAFEAYCRDTGDVRFRRIISNLRETGEWPFSTDIIVGCEMPRRGTFFINALCHCGIDGTDDASLTRGMIEGRSEAHSLFQIMRKHMPGFSRCRLTQTSPAIGIRETRRVVGRYTLADQDLLAGRSFDDTVALTGYQWDMTDPKKPSHQPMDGKPITKPYTEIPYRCLVPQAIDNLIVAGRSISVSWNALGPVRIMPCCFATGQAAGAAAALAAASGAAVGECDPHQLQNVLRSAGAIIQPAIG